MTQYSIKKSQTTPPIIARTDKPIQFIQNTLSTSRAGAFLYTNNEVAEKKSQGINFI